MKTSQSTKPGTDGGLHLS